MPLSQTSYLGASPLARRRPSPCRRCVPGRDPGNMTTMTPSPTRTGVAGPTRFRFFHRTRLAPHVERARLPVARVAGRALCRCLLHRLPRSDREPHLDRCWALRGRRRPVWEVTAGDRCTEAWRRRCSRRRASTRAVRVAQRFLAQARCTLRGRRRLAGAALHRRSPFPPRSRNLRLTAVLALG